MITIYTTSEPFIPSGIYIESARGKLISLQDAVRNRPDWSIFNGQRVAIVQGANRLMLDSRDAGYRISWEEAVKKAKDAGGRLFTRHEAIDLSIARENGLETALNILMANPLCGEYWTKDEDDNPMDVGQLAYTVQYPLFRIQPKVKRMVAAARFVFDF